LVLMVKVHYKLPYRMLEGFTRYLFEQIHKIKMPTYSLTCKRAKTLGAYLPKLSERRPNTVLVDSSGVKVLGEGEWKVKMHGPGRSRKWIKIHVAVDEKTQEIVGEVTKDSSVGDSAVFDTLFEQVPRTTKKIIADGAYDTQDIRRAIRQRGAFALIPPPKNGVCHGKDRDRDDAIRAITAFGGDKDAKSIWGKLSGYSRRALVETTFSRLKKMFGERMFSRCIERQKVENRIKCLLLNKMLPRSRRGYKEPRLKVGIGTLQRCPSLT
jgi:hypothetical protein